MSILQQIFEDKRLEVASAIKQRPYALLEEQVSHTPPPPDFVQALTDSTKTAPRLIAEVKHKSPSKGVLRKTFDPLELANAYQKNGAAAISVLTDAKYFGGSLQILGDIRALNLGLPLLRKDFIFDTYQLLEARLAGASAILLIVAMLDQENLAALVNKCFKLGLTPLVEVHDQSELERALTAEAKVIGINNRNLHDFSVTIETSLHLAQLCPPEITLVSESGIKSQEDMERLRQVDVDAILVGEALVTAQDVAKQVRHFTQAEVG
jgi:indole-3-glycerol phosphate synthase